jgi:hypothetical protein
MLKKPNKKIKKIESYYTSYDYLADDLFYFYYENTRKL